MSPKNPETPVRIETEIDFRQKVGLSGSSISLDWKKDRVIETTEGDLARLRADISGQSSADDKQKAAEAFLRAQEKEEAADTLDRLPDKIGANLLKNPAVLAAVGTVAAGIGTVVHKLDKHAEETTGVNVGFMDSIRSWLKKAVNESDGVMKKFWGLFYKILGGKDLVEKGDDSGRTEHIGSDKYIAKGLTGSAKIFDKLRRNPNPPDDSIRTIFVTRVFLEKTPEELNQLKNTYKADPKGLAKTMGLPETDGEKVLRAIGVYFSPENQLLISSSTAKKDDVSKMTLASIYAGTLKYEQFLEKIREKKLNLSKDHLSFREEASNMTESVKEFVGEKKEILEALHERYEGFTPNVLKIIHQTYGTEPIEKIDFHTREKDFKKGKDGEKQGEWEFVTQTLPEYAKALPSLVRKFSFGNPDAEKVIEGHLKSPGLKQSDLIDFFVLSGGNTEFEKMNGYEKAQCALRVMLMLRGEHSSEAKTAGYKYFNAMILSSFDKEKSVNIPPEVKAIIRDTMGLFAEGITLLWEETKAQVTALLSDHLIASLGVSTGVIAIVWMAIKMVNPVVRTAISVGFILKFLGVSAVLLAGWKWIESSEVFQNEKTGKRVALADITKALPKT